MDAGSRGSSMLCSFVLEVGARGDRTRRTTRCARSSAGGCRECASHERARQGSAGCARRLRAWAAARWHGRVHRFGATAMMGADPSAYGYISCRKATSPNRSCSPTRDQPSRHCFGSRVPRTRTGALRPIQSTMSACVLSSEAWTIGMSHDVNAVAPPSTPAVSDSVRALGGFRRASASTTAASAVSVCRSGTHSSGSHDDFANELSPVCRRTVASARIRRALSSI